MSEQHEQLQVEGIVHLRDIYLSPRPWSLGVEIESSDAMWEIAESNDRSPYLAFAERRVVMAGVPQKAPLCHPIARVGGKPRRYLRVSTMRLVEAAPDVPFVEIGTPQHQLGRFQRGTNDSGEPSLSFATERAEAFLVANDPAGLTVGSPVKVLAYPVLPSSSLRRSSERYLWIIAPCECADCWRAQQDDPAAPSIAFGRDGAATA